MEDDDAEEFANLFRDTLDQGFERYLVDYIPANGNYRATYTYTYESKNMTTKESEKLTPEERYPDEEDINLRNIARQAQNEWGNSVIEVTLVLKRTQNEHDYNAVVTFKYSWRYNEEITAKHNGTGEGE